MVHPPVKTKPTDYPNDWATYLSWRATPGLPLRKFSPRERPSFEHRNWHLLQESWATFL